MRQQRRGDGAAARRRRSTSASTTCGSGRSTARRCASCSTSSSSARCTTAWPRRSARRPRRARRRRRRRARGRGRPRSTRPADAVAALDALPPADGAAGRRPRAWAGAEGRSPLDGLALVVDGDAAEVAWIAGDAARRRRRCATRCARSLAGGRPHRRARRQGADARRCSAVDVDLRTPRPRHDARRLPARPGRDAATCSTTCSLRYADLELPVGDAAARGPARPRRRRRRRRRSRPAAARARRRPRSSSRRCAALDAQGMRALHDDIEVPARAACWPGWRTSASASTPTELQRAQRPARRPSATALDAEHPGRRRARSSTSTPRRSCARSCSTSSACTPHEEDEDRASRPTPASLEKLAGQHPIIEHLLRYREVEKLRSTYGEGLLAEVARRRPHPRHVQPDRGPHRPALVATQPNLHNIPVRSEEGRQFRKAFVPADGLRAARRRLQPDRAARASPTSPRTRG